MYPRVLASRVEPDWHHAANLGDVQVFVPARAVHLLVDPGTRVDGHHLAGGRGYEGDDVVTARVVAVALKLVDVDDELRLERRGRIAAEHLVRETRSFPLVVHAGRGGYRARGILGGVSRPQFLLT